MLPKQLVATGNSTCYTPIYIAKSGYMYFAIRGPFLALRASRLLNSGAMHFFREDLVAKLAITVNTACIVWMV